MTHALPAAPAPPPSRQVFVGTALAGAATLMLVGGMLAVWILQRERALDAGELWVPKGIKAGDGVRLAEFTNLRGLVDQILGR